MKTGDGALGARSAGVENWVEPTIGIEPMNLFLTKEVLYLLSYVGLREAAGKMIGEGPKRKKRERDPSEA